MEKAGWVLGLGEPRPRSPFCVANGPLVAVFGLCGCKDFEGHNGKKRKKEEEAVVVVVVRFKHLIAGVEAEGPTDRRDYNPAPTGNISPPPLILEERSKARGAEAGGGHKP